MFCGLDLRVNQGAVVSGLSAVRSSVAGVRERPVRSTAAAEAVAELDRTI
jgi:hypothetical protein